MEEPKTTKQCWECRGRRLVCDFTRPGCQKCKLKGLACPGYDGVKPLKWLQPQEVKSKGRGRFDFRQPVQPARPSGESDRASNIIAVSRSLKPEREMTDILEAFEYYNVHICPDLVATGIGGAQSPYFMQHVAVHVLPRSFTHSIVCTALCHRVLQSSDAPDKVVLARRLQQHRGESLRALAADLARPEGQTSDWTLASVLLLLLAEIQQSVTPNWRYHSNGAAVMIELRGGLGDLVFSRPYLRHVFRYYAIIEVMGVTTSPDVDIDSARKQLELISLLPILYGNGLATCFPCPPDLFTEIIHINHLRSRFQSITTTTTDTHKTLLREDKCSAALDILRRIKAFQPDNWAAEVAFGITKSGIGESAATVSASFRDWQTVAVIYQSAIALYCMASLLHGNPSTVTSDTFDINRTTTDPHLAPHAVLAKARKTCRSVLLSRLREVSKCTLLRKVVLWPLVVAGIEVDDEVAKRYVSGELKWISHALGTASPLVARGFLERRVWGLELGKRRWEGLFDQSYVFVL